MHKLSLSEKIGIVVILFAAVPYFLSIIVSTIIYSQAKIFIDEQQKVIMPERRLIGSIKTNALYLGLLARDADLHLMQRNDIMADKTSLLLQQTISKITDDIARYKQEFIFSNNLGGQIVDVSGSRGLAEEKAQTLQKLENAIQDLLRQIVLRGKDGVRAPIVSETSAIVSQSENLMALLDRFSAFSIEAYQERTRLFFIGLLSFWVLTVGGSGLLVILLNRKVTKPIKQLSEIAIDIAGGKTRAVPYRKEKDEVTDLYNAVRSMDDSLLQNIRELDKASKTKSEFIAIASHQLRTPLSAIKWLVELLEENSNLTKEQKLSLGDIYESNERLIMLVNDLLNVSRFESGKLQASLVSTDLANLIKLSIKSVVPDAEIKAQKINLVIGSGVGKASVDQILFNETFINVIQNAIAYAPNGSSIDVKVSKDGSNYVIAVHNDGPAIPEIEHEKLFTKFYRGTVAQRLRPTGSGLGLFISKAAIEAQGGRIWFESPTSHDGNGATFFISIPVR